MRYLEVLCQQRQRLLVLVLNHDIRLALIARGGHQGVPVNGGSMRMQDASSRNRAYPEPQKNSVALRNGRLGVQVVRELKVRADALLFLLCEGD